MPEKHHCKLQLKQVNWVFSRCKIIESVQQGCQITHLGHIKVVNLLVKSGADVNVVHGDKNRTALHLAAQTGNQFDMTKFLMQSNDNISYLGREKIANVLVNNGANVNSVDTLLRSPLHVATRNGNLLTKLNKWTIRFEVQQKVIAWITQVKKGSQNYS